MSRGGKEEEEDGPNSLINRLWVQGGRTTPPVYPAAERGFFDTTLKGEKPTNGSMAQIDAAPPTSVATCACERHVKTTKMACSTVSDEFANRRLHREFSCKGNRGGLYETRTTSDFEI